MNITGRLTKDAEVRTLSNSRQVVNFSVAVNESYRNKKGEKVEQTTFFECAYWISAKVAGILTKGALVELAGRVSARAWKGNDGELRAGLNFTTSQITLHAGGQKSETAKSASKEQKTLLETKPLIGRDDVPF
ncbi:single-stranded DNA-binding protein [Flavobacterium notoginsengisoli]|uniref:single-stranded DNA-binding protein n=1 Tax=Flavobacterium notoginsengisoli TaxID=1478199 RepID=UPI00362AADB1